MSAFFQFLALPVVAVFTATIGSAESAAILQLRPDGPMSAIHSLRFSSSGDSLFATGDEKIVQAWKLKGQLFQRDHAASLRHRIGPGPIGVINAFAQSQDEQYVVVGGIGVFTKHAGFSDNGILMPSVGWSREVLNEIGTVTVFDRARQQSHLLPAHAGYVLATEIVTLPGTANHYLATVGNDEEIQECGVSGESVALLRRSLRLFTLPDGKLVAQWPIPNSTLKPQLVAWVADKSAGVNGIRIAVAVAEGKQGGAIEIFSPGVNTPSRFKDPFAVSVTRVGGSNVLYASSYRRLNMIDGISATSIKQISLQSQLSESEIIFSVQSVNSQRQLIALIYRDISNPASQHKLQLLDAGTGRFVLQQPIEIGNRQNPILAVDSLGERLAAVADVSQGIQVYQIKNLINGLNRPTQVITSEFQAIKDAAIISDGAVNRLHFTVLQNGNAQSYDFVDNRLQASSLSGIESYDQELRFIKSLQGNDYKSSYMVQEVSAPPIVIESSLPPIGKWISSRTLGGRPLAAVSFIQHGNEGQPQLSLFDVSSGAELRRLNGHQQQVIALRFSKDQKRLTTVSADGMICVWSLEDLGKVFGVRGTIEGLRWCAKNGTIRLNGFADPKKTYGLVVGDQLVGLVNDDKKVQLFESVEALYQAISRIKPDTVATLRIQRSEAMIDVVLKIGQATDERKPLFSFIAKRNATSKELDWLVWTPMGPFQSSGVEIEQHVGWHFNPDDNRSSAKFAPFSQYRDQFFGDDLVKELLVSGALPAVWPPHITASLAIRAIDSEGKAIHPFGQAFQSADAIDRFEISVSGLPPSLVTEVTATVDERQRLVLTRSDSAPEIWMASMIGELEPGVIHSLGIQVKSDRLVDGSVSAIWTVQTSHLTLPNAISGTESPSMDSVLPPIRITSHPAESDVLRESLDGDSRLALAAVLGDETMPENAEIFGILNGKTVELQSPSVKGNQVTAIITLPIGLSRLSIGLRVKDKQSVSPTINVNVIDPPRIVSLSGVVKQDNFGELGLVIDSSDDVTKAGIKLLVEGIEVPQALFDCVVERNSEREFRMQLSEIPLREGANLIEVQLFDASVRRCDKAQTTLIGLPLPKQPKLNLDLTDGLTVEKDSIEISASVDSQDLQIVTCKVGNVDVPVELPRAGASGLREFFIKIPLQPGIQRIVVSAVSKANLIAIESRTISRIERPVAISVAEFVGTDENHLQLQRQSNGSYEATRSATSSAGKLEGQVILTSNNDGIHSGNLVIRAWVNGFLQSVVTLKKGKRDGELQFSIPILLSTEQNDIQLELPGLIEAEGLGATIRLGCLRPSLDQTLHLLVVSTRVSWKKRTEFEKRVLDLLGASKGTMPAFSRVISGSPVYPALTGNVSRSDNVRQLIEQCQFELASQQATNNTVLIYFQGDELRASDGRMCLMTQDVNPEKAFEDKNLITSSYLGEKLRELKCANLLFLDVTPHLLSAETNLAGDPSQPGLGVLRMSHTPSLQNKPTTPLLLEHVRNVLPRVGKLVQLTQELEAGIKDSKDIAINKSFPTSIERMRFGERLDN